MSHLLELEVIGCQSGVVNLKDHTAIVDGGILDLKKLKNKGLALLHKEYMDKINIVSVQFCMGEISWNTEGAALVHNLAQGPRDLYVDEELKITVREHYF